MYIPDPIERKDYYYSYLTNGSGDIPDPVDRVDHYLYYLCVNGFGGGGTVTPDQIDKAVERYLLSNPVEAGATEEQEKQIEANKKAIEQLQEDSKDYLTEIPIATTEILGGVIPDGETINVDENGVISAKTGGSAKPGATEEQAQQIQDNKDNIEKIDSKIAEIEGSIPAKTSDLENDSGFITTDDLPEEEDLTYEECIEILDKKNVG